jgi:octaprenyl-diphosphate synthase
LRDGNPSLPIVLTLPRSQLLARVWRTEDPAEDEVDAGLAEIRTSGVLERVRREAIGYTRHAAEALASLPDTPYRDFLETLLSELRDRVR